MGLHGCRLNYPVRHPVVQTDAFQLRTIDTATLAKPDWVVCKHANPQMFKEGMPEIMPIPDDENFELRADRDRMTNPIPARDDRCIVLESKRQQARCRFSEIQRHSFKNVYPDASPQLPMTLHEKFVEQIRVKPDETRSVFHSIVYEANLNAVLVKFFPKVQARIVEMFSQDKMEDTVMMHDCLKSIAKKLPCRNSNIVMFNPALTSLTGSNTAAAYFLGMPEQARGALFYLVKYLTKDKTELSASLVVLLDARKHVDRYPSVADDTGTARRTTQHFLLQVLKSLSGMSEFGAPQAASVVMERPCTWVSHEFTYLFPYEILDWLAQRRSNRRTTQRDATQNADNTAHMPQRSSVLPQASRISHTSAQHVLSSSTQAAHAAQMSRRGLRVDSGDEAWLNLEQVASLIQYHNNAIVAQHRIVTTLLQGVSQDQ